MSSFFTSFTGCISWAETGLCSGRGICMLVSNNGTMFTQISEANVPNSQCVCDGGWTGVADWVTAKNIDCSHPVLFVVLAYTIQLITSLICLGTVVFKLTLSLHRVYRNLREEAIKTNIGDMDYGISIWKSWFRLKLVRLSLISLWMPLCSVIIALLRLSSGGLEYTIGDAVSTTVLRALVQLFWWGFAIYYLHSWIILSLHIAQVIRNRINVLSLVNFYYCLGVIGAAVTASSIVILLFLSPSLDLYSRNVLSFIFIHCVMVSSALAAATSVITGNKVVNMLLQEKSTLPYEQQNDRMKAIATLNFLMKNFKSAGIQNVLLGLLFAYWPWLRSYYMYLQVVQCVFMASLIFIAVRSLHPPPRLKPSDLSTPRNSRTSRRLNNSTRNLTGTGTPPDSAPASPGSTPQLSAMAPNAKTIEDLEKELYLIIPRFHTPSTSRRMKRRKPSAPSMIQTQETEGEGGPQGDFVPRPSGAVVDIGLVGGLGGLGEAETSTSRKHVEVQLTVFEENRNDSSQEERGSKATNSSTPTPSTATTATSLLSSPSITQQPTSSEEDNPTSIIGGLRRSVTKQREPHDYVPMSALVEEKSPPNTPPKDGRSELELSIQMERSARLTVALRTQSESLIVTVQNDRDSAGREGDMDAGLRTEREDEDTPLSTES